MTPKYLSVPVTKRVGYSGCYYLVVPDHAAGRRNRFTVYRVPSSPAGRVKVVGRELPLGYARKYIKELEAR